MVPRKPPSPQVPYEVGRVLFMVEYSSCLEKRQIFNFKNKIDNDGNTIYMHWTRKNGKDFRKLITLILINCHALT